MKTKHCWATIYLLATFVIWSAKIVPSAAYYQAPGGGYTLSIPSFNDAEKRNQVDAQNWCNGNQSKLLEIRNKNIQAWTVSFIANAINQNQMTGNIVMTNGKRSNSGLTWVNGLRYNGGLTVSGQESGYSHSYAYIQVTRSGFQFVADTPLVKRSYICEGLSFCNNGFRASERCYSITRETLSWYDARNQCIDKGGDLASFDFIANDTGFNALNGSGLNPSSTYWIGLTRQNWTWQDSKSEVRYSQWSDGHPYYPDGTYNSYMECLCLLPNPTTYDWLWSECDCTQSYQFVCMTASTTNLTSLAPSLTSGSPISVSFSTAVSLAVQSGSTPSLSSPSSLSNSGSTGLPSTATRSNSSSGDSSPTAVSIKTDNNNSLAIGLGVGIGGGVLLIAVVSVLVFVVMKRKGCPRKSGLQKPSSDPPDVTPESYYAAVVRTTDDDNSTTDDNQLPPSTEYAELSIVAATESTDDGLQTGRSLV